MNKSGVSAWYENYFGPDYLKIDIQLNTEEEVEFIYDVLRLEPGTSLLDVACGYGRHLVPLVKRGVDVIGCDLSLFMLGKATGMLRKKRVTGCRFVLCDTRALPFGHVFDCACNMFNSFGYFEREDDNFRVLKSIAQALKPGGLFLLDLINRDFLLHSFNAKEWFIHNGAVILEKRRFDPVQNRSEVDVSVIDKKGKRTYHHSIRLYSYTELVMLLDAAGFTVRAVFGGFNGEEFDWHHNRMLILAQSMEKEEE